MPRFRKTAIPSLLLLCATTVYVGHFRASFSNAVERFTRNTGNLLWDLTNEASNCSTGNSKLPCAAENDWLRTNGIGANDRLLRVRDVCTRPEISSREKDRLNGLSITYMKPKHFQHFIVDDVNKIMYCYVSKAGNSHWKAIMAVMGGALKDPGKYQYESVERVPIKTGSVIHEPKFFRKLSDFKMSEIFNRLDDPSYKIFTFVRHPYTRILSAYKDKFSLQNKVVRKKYDRLYGNYIFNKYQKKNQSEADPEYKVSWEAFVRYLADPNTKDLNEHWELQYKLCNPCQVPFDVIGKIENADTEALNWVSFLEKRLQKSSKTDQNGNTLTKLQYPSAYSHSADAETVKKYFSKFPKSILDGLYARYKLDFEIFGYDPHVF